MAAAQMDNMIALEKILGSPDWEDLSGRLLEYVENFELKVVQARTGFQL